MQRSSRSGARRARAATGSCSSAACATVWQAVQSAPGRCTFSPWGPFASTTAANGTRSAKPGTAHPQREGPTPRPCSRSSPTRFTVGTKRSLTGEGRAQRHLMERSGRAEAGPGREAPDGVRRGHRSRYADEDGARGVVLHEDGSVEGEAVIVRPFDGDRAAAVLNVERERLRVDGAVGSDGNRRIRGPIEWAARGHGQPGEAAGDPRAAAVPRGREAGIDTAARLVEAPLLKDGHDDVGVVRVERDIGFGLRVGLRAGEAGEGIGADLLCGARTEGGRHLTVHDASEDQDQDGNPDGEPHQNPAWGYTLRGRRGSTLAAK